MFYVEECLVPLISLLFSTKWLDQFIRYFEYCRRLKFEEKPDYGYLRRMFKELAMKEGFEYDHVFDWILIPMVIPCSQFQMI